MATSTPAILTLMIVLLWQYVFVAPLSVNPVFRIQILSQEVAVEILTSMSISFAPSLLEVLQADTPPTIEFFESLPELTDLDRDTWWVYCAIVLEKPGCRSIICIGSGTHFDEGVRRRFRSYDNDFQLPFYVDAALQKGFRITHKGLLCWTRRLSILLQFQYSLFFRALEVVLTFVFWVVHCSTEYGFSMTAPCPWPRNSFEYDDPCGHSPLSEGINGTPDLSEEEAHELELRIVEKERLDKARYYKNHKGEIAVSRAQYHEDHKEEIAAKQVLSREAIKKKKRFCCGTCDHTESDKHGLERHCVTEKHLMAIRLDEASIKATMDKAMKYVCECGFRTGAPRQSDETFKIPKISRRDAKVQESIAMDSGA